MTKRKIFIYPPDNENPLYVVCELNNQEQFYAVKQKDFLSANKKSDEPIECLLFEIEELQDSINYQLTEPLQTVNIERGHLAGIFLH